MKIYYDYACDEMLLISDGFKGGMFSGLYEYAVWDGKDSFKVDQETMLYIRNHCEYLGEL